MAEPTTAAIPASRFDDLLRQLNELKAKLPSPEQDILLMTQPVYEQLAKSPGWDRPGYQVPGYQAGCPGTLLLLGMPFEVYADAQQVWERAAELARQGHRPGVCVVARPDPLKENVNG